ncbi:DUF4350 domain-containing protein [Haladaptatus sp. NG-SE-30]
MKRLPEAIPELAFATMVILLVVTIVIAGSTSSHAFSAYNTDWDGTSDLRVIGGGSDVRTTTIHDTAGYSNHSPEKTVAFVLSPDSAYGSTDFARLTEFVRKGGTLVVATQSPTPSNELLGTLDVSARINGHPLRDVQSNYRSSALPVANDVANRSLVAGVDSLTLNYGTAVEPHEAAVLVNTSENAYLDTDRNGQLSGNESLGERSVATVESIGDGQVIVVSDPSVFINTMLEREGNRQFTRALLAPHDTLLLDFSHAAGLPPLVFAVLVVRESGLLQLGLGVLAIAILGQWSRPSNLIPKARESLLQRFRGDDSPSNVRASKAELTAYLKRRHPDWDDERIDRVVSAVKRRQR